MPKKKKTAPAMKTAPCHICAGEMTHISTIPPAVKLPELFTFKCGLCGCRRTELRENAEPQQDAA